MADFSGQKRFTRKALMIAGLCFVAGAGLWYIMEMNRKKRTAVDSSNDSNDNKQNDVQIPLMSDLLPIPNDDESIEEPSKMDKSTTIEEEKTAAIDENNNPNDDNQQTDEAMMVIEENSDKTTLSKTEIINDEKITNSATAVETSKDSADDKVTEVEQMDKTQENELPKENGDKSHKSISRQKDETTESTAIVEENSDKSTASKTEIVNHKQVNEKQKSLNDAHDKQQDKLDEKDSKPLVAKQMDIAKKNELPKENGSESVSKQKAKNEEDKVSKAMKELASLDSDFVMVDKSEKKEDKNAETKPAVTGNNDNDKGLESENETVSVVMVEKESENKEEDDNVKDLIKRSDQITEFKFKNGKLKINLLRATHMEDKDIGFKKDDLSDVMVKFDVTKQKHQKSTIVKNSENPDWNGEMFVFDVDDPLKDTLTATVEDYDELVNDKIGTVIIKIIDVVNAKDSCIKEGKFDVVGSKYGWLFLDLMYYEESS